LSWLVCVCISLSPSLSLSLYTVGWTEGQGCCWASYIYIYLFICLLRCSHCVAQAGLKLVILLPQPLQCWDYRQEPPHPAKDATELWYTGCSYS
jgi:hypothetical protein